MWTLAQTRERLGDRLAEASTVFWDAGIRNDAINEAQRFISAVTNGVPEVLTGTVNASTPYLTITGTLVGDFVTAGTADNQALTTVPLDHADVTFPEWRNLRGWPRWALVDVATNRVYVAPVPTTDLDVELRVAVLPDPLDADSAPLFGGVKVMEQYQGVLLNVAAALCLLRERYDGDAERFYQFGINELQALGVRPGDIPPLNEIGATA